MAGTTRLELATSAVTGVVVVTSCNFTAPIATLGALRNPQEVLLHPYCTRICCPELPVWRMTSTDSRLCIQVSLLLRIKIAGRRLATACRRLRSLELPTKGT